MPHKDAEKKALGKLHDPRISDGNTMAPKEANGINRSSALHAFMNAASVDSAGPWNSTTTPSTTLTSAPRAPTECAMYAATCLAKETIRATISTVLGDPIALTKAKGNDETVATGCSAEYPTVLTKETTW